MTKVFSNPNIPQKLDFDSAHKYCAGLIHDLFANAPMVIRPITMHMLSAPGKGIRTSLLFTSAIDSDGLVPRDAVCAAAAIEIFHLATLVHDDVIDEADTRRGIESVQSKFSKKEAIICGDYLFCLAFAAISSIYEPYAKFAKKFTSAISQICLGELRQYTNNYNTGILFYEYLRTIYGKTAVLFHLSAYGGALVGGACEKEVELLGKFGRYFGMIFQIMDDCKDYALNDAQALKPTQNDINSGVVNLPLLMAFLKEPQLRKAAFDMGLISDVHRLGGVPASVDVAKKYEKKAKKALSALGDRNKASRLEDLMSQALNMLMEGAHAT